MYHVLSNDFSIYYVLYVRSTKISNITSLRTNHPSVHMYLARHASTTSRYQITFDKKQIIGINLNLSLKPSLQMMSQTNIILATIFRDEQGFLAFRCISGLYRSRKMQGNIEARSINSVVKHRVICLLSS